MKAKWANQEKHSEKQDKNSSEAQNGKAEDQSKPNIKLHITPNNKQNNTSPDLPFPATKDAPP